MLQSIDSALLYNFPGHLEPLPSLMREEKEGKNNSSNEDTKESISNSFQSKIIILNKLG